MGETGTDFLGILLGAGVGSFSLTYLGFLRSSSGSSNAMTPLLFLLG